MDIKTVICKGLLVWAIAIISFFSFVGIGECEDHINIIPTPKEIKVLPGKVAISEKNMLLVTGNNRDSLSFLGAEEINKKIKELGEVELLIRKEGELSEGELNEKNLILLGTPEEHILLKSYLAKHNMTLEGLKPSGYLIISVEERDRTIYLLAGKDPQGVLYAAVSFRHLIRKNEDGFYALKVNIKDWPDCKYRSIFISPSSKESYAKTLPYLDWCLYHKVNHVHISLWGFTNGSFTIPDKKGEEWFANINDYAHHRGIDVCGHCFYTVVGSIIEDKDNPEFADVWQRGRGYWSWDNDTLIKRRAEKTARFIKNAHCRSILFHFPDGSPTALWSDVRSKRWGANRAGADANYINIMYKAIRRESPGTRLIFVVEPYYGNLDIPENKSYQDYFQKLTNLIPEDVYLVNAAWDRESQDSWKKVVRQPVYQWRNILMDPYHAGRDFSSQPALSIKSGYYPESNDIAFPNVHIGYSDPGEAFVLLAIECMWNVDTPGTMMLRSDTTVEPYRSIEDLYALPMQKIDGLPYEDWLWFKSTSEPREIIEDLLPRLCEEAYGKDAAMMMTEILKMGIARKALLMSCNVSQCRGVAIIKDQYVKAEKAVSMLEEFKAKGKDFKPGAGGFSFFNQIVTNLDIAKRGGKSHYYLLLAEELAKEKKFQEAEENLMIAEDTLKKAKKELASWKYTQLVKVEKAVESFKFRLSLLKLSETKTEKSIKVAIYNPKEREGRVYGELAIYSTLLQSEEISPVFIPSLEHLFQYDVVIIPDCKKFGRDDTGTFLIIEKEVWKAEDILRKYVIEEGGGLLMYHDSVGYNRFPPGRSFFPEFCIGTKRVEGTGMTVAVEHPVVQGYGVGETQEYMYYDHISMTKGKTGQIILIDTNNEAVVIAGEMGKGRVVLNGSIIYLRTGEPKVAQGIDKDLLINSVFWLAGTNKRR